MTIAVAAGATVMVNVTGQVFACDEASAEFFLLFDSQNSTLVRGGMQISVPGGFRTLSFQNASSDTLTVKYYVSDDLFTMPYVKQASTVLVASSYSLAAGAMQDHPGVVNGRRRKSIVVSNTHATDVIKLRDADTDVNLLQIAASGTSPVLETDADLKVRNPGANPITVNVGEFFYV